jgi:hypothetical protein
LPIRMEARANSLSDRAAMWIANRPGLVRFDPESGIDQARELGEDVFR